MLIYLTPELREYFEENDYTDEDVEAIENIITSHRKCYHFVTAKRKCLEFYSGIDGLSRSSKKQLTMLRQDRATVSGIYEQIKTKIIVVPPTEKYNRKDVEENHNIEYLNDTVRKYSEFEIPLDRFLENEILEKVRMVSEHLDDCDIYDSIASNFIKLKDLPGKISFEKVHGGGNDTHKVYLEKIVQGYIVTSIVDSDKIEPASNIGTTARQVNDVFENNKMHKLISIEILPFHEKENLFSPVIYKHFGKNINPEALNQLIKLTDSEVGRKIYPYLDFKKGLHSGNYTDFYSEILDNEEIISDDTGLGKKADFLSHVTSQLAIKTELREKIYLVGLLGTAPLGDFNIKKITNNLKTKLDSYNSRTPHQIVRKEREKLDVIENLFDYLLEFQREYFMLFAQNICEWGIANSRRSS